MLEKTIPDEFDFHETTYQLASYQSLVHQEQRLHLGYCRLEAIRWCLPPEQTF